MILSRIHYLSFLAVNRQHIHLYLCNRKHYHEIYNGNIRSIRLRFKSIVIHLLHCRTVGILGIRNCPTSPVIRHPTKKYAIFTPCTSLKDQKYTICTPFSRNTMRNYGKLREFSLSQSTPRSLDFTDFPRI